MTKTKHKDKKKRSHTFWWVTLGVFIFCIGLRVILIGNFERPDNLNNYEEVVATITGKQKVEERATKTTYTIALDTGTKNYQIEVGKQDYTNLEIGDAIRTLVSEDIIQLGTKEQPYTLIKVKE